MRNVALMPSLKKLDMSNNEFNCETVSMVMQVLMSLKEKFELIRENDAVKMQQEDDNLYIGGIRCTDEPMEVTNVNLMEQLYDVIDVMSMLVVVEKKHQRTYNFNKLQYEYEHK